MSEDNRDKQEAKPNSGRKGTDEPWKRPGQSSQNPNDKPPPKREPKATDNNTQ